jgi:hypothetical protein
MRVCASHNPDLPCIQGVHPHPTPRNRPVFPVRRKRTRSSYAVQMGQTRAKRPPLVRAKRTALAGRGGMLRHGARGMLRHGGRGMRGRGMRGMRGTGSMGREGPVPRGARTREARERDAGGAGTQDTEAGRRYAEYGTRRSGTWGCGTRDAPTPGKQTHRWPSGGHCRPVRPTVRSGRVGSWPTRHRDRELLILGR